MAGLRVHGTRPAPAPQAPAWRVARRVAYLPCMFEFERGYFSHWVGYWRSKPEEMRGVIQQARLETVTWKTSIVHIAPSELIRGSHGSGGAKPAHSENGMLDMSYIIDVAATLAGVKLSVWQKLELAQLSGVSRLQCPQHAGSAGGKRLRPTSRDEPTVEPDLGSPGEPSWRSGDYPWPDPESGKPAGVHTMP